MFRSPALAAAILVLAAATAANAQAVDAFNPGANGDVYAIAIQPDGKILVGGAFTGLGGGGTTTRNRIGRLNADGTVDVGFNPGANGVVHAIAIQPDGKIVVGGTFTGLGGGTGTTSRNRLGRLNADGTVDISFDPGATGVVFGIALQPDGKILVSGSFSGLGGGTGTTTRNFIGRLNADGTVDIGFNPGANFSANGIAIQPDGKILVIGGFSMLGGGTGTTTRHRIGRLNVDGSLDATFDPGANNAVFAMAVQPDGKILVGGVFTGLGGGTGTTTRNRIGRLNGDGTVDAGFAPGANDGVYGLALQADGRILVGGAFTGLGGGTGATPRLRIGRLNAAGTVDMSFDPGATNVVYGIALQPDGHVLVGGTFSGLGDGVGATERLRIGRLLNNIAATQSLTVTGSSVVTWSRGGASPELQWAQFAFSTDGLTYTDLGPGTRVAGGWQISGLSLPAGPNLTIRARGFYAMGKFTASGSIAELVAVPATNLIQNGTFANGTANWSQFATPDISYIVSSVSPGGVFEFRRVAPPVPGTINQATVFQNTGAALPAGAPLTASFQLGNTGAERKYVKVLIVGDTGFGDLTACVFWLAANQPLTTYGMRGHTTRAATNVAIYFYASSVHATGGFYQLDNVSLRYTPTESAERTDCIDPNAPAPPGGAPSSNLLVNGDFQTGLPAPWQVLGPITSQITGGVFEFIRTASPNPPAVPPAVMLQSTGQAMTANQIMTMTLRLGNSSPVRKRALLLVNDLAFGDFFACTWWVEPGQVLSTFAMKFYASAAWTNATVSIYPSTTGPDPWIRLDDVTLARTPAASTVGTECLEGSQALALAPNGPAPAPSGVDPAPSAFAGPARDTADDARNGAGWQAVARGHGVEVLYWARPIDLTDAASARLTFRSAWSPGGSSGEAQVSVDGITWQTIASVSDGSAWVSVDLTPYIGQVVYVRFVFKTVAPDAGARPDVLVPSDPQSQPGIEIDVPR